MKTAITGAEKDGVIEMAREDRTPIEAIEVQFGLFKSKSKTPVLS